MPPLPTLASLEWSTACQTSPPPSLGLPLILAAAFPFGRMSGGARARLSRTLEPNYVWHWSLRNWVSHSDCRRRPRCLDGETIHGLQALKDSSQQHTTPTVPGLGPGFALRSSRQDNPLTFFQRKDAKSQRTQSSFSWRLCSFASWRAKWCWASTRPECAAENRPGRGTPLHEMKAGCPWACTPGLPQTA
jgi:hypothetical protein